LTISAEGATNVCRRAGARAWSKFAIVSEVVRLLDAAKEEFVVGGGKAVKVCEVDVMEEDVLPVVAILTRPPINLSSSTF
jgi:hypothetical protein